MSDAGAFERAPGGDRHLLIASTAIGQWRRRENMRGERRRRRNRLQRNAVDERQYDVIDSCAEDKSTIDAATLRHSNSKQTTVSVAIYGAKPCSVLSEEENAFMKSNTVSDNRIKASISNQKQRAP